jgi:tetraacyldisaccharide 4'-kinase
MMLISQRVPEAVVIANPDRVRAGLMALAECQARALVLDDGFQHRRLGRDLDIVLIDALQPFGYGHVLPRGLLRESLSGLRRAEAVVLTRCDQVSPDELAGLEAVIRRINPDVPVVRAMHRPKGFVNLQGRMVTEPNKHVGAFAGIARPEAFLRSLTSVGFTAADHRWWPDHHAYTSADVQSLSQWARKSRFDALVTTEKDAVKLVKVTASWPVPVSVLRVEIEMLDGGDKILEQLIDQMLANHEGHL